MPVSHSSCLLYLKRKRCWTWLILISLSDLKYSFSNTDLDSCVKDCLLNHSNREQRTPRQDNLSGVVDQKDLVTLSRLRRSQSLFVRMTPILIHLILIIFIVKEIILFIVWFSRESEEGFSELSWLSWILMHVVLVGQECAAMHFHTFQSLFFRQWCIFSVW
jgi:hypothetical protein